MITRLFSVEAALLSELLGERLVLRVVEKELRVGHQRVPRLLLRARAQFRFRGSE
jgi:hypothetical protein